MRVGIYIYIQMRVVTTGKPVSDKHRRLHTHTHTHTRTHTESGMETLPEALGRSAKQRQPLEDLHRTRLRRRQREEKSSVPVRQDFVFHKTRPLFQYLSLSFKAQGGRPLPPVTSCLFPVLSDRDTPRFSP